MGEGKSEQSQLYRLGKRKRRVAGERNTNKRKDTEVSGTEWIWRLGEGEFTC